LTTEQAWQHIGATPMIGQNDTVAERFQLSDAQELLAFAERNHLRRLSMWSLNRDQSCGPNYANVEIVSDDCSGVNQTPSAYTKLFSAISTKAVTPDSTGGSSSSTPSASNPNASVTATSVDNPATSPYPIWNPAQAYPANTKIVWHHNVYEAKWYTQGDVPDLPVAQAADTPWTLIGPVLPGEHPAPTPTLPEGTYPDWNSTTVYVAGNRVLYQGLGYQAKWWTSGNVPGLQVANPGDTPWALITSASASATASTSPVNGPQSATATS